MSTLNNPTLTVVVPCFNEGDGTNKLYSAISQTLDAHGIPWKLVLVDDGSTDSTAQQIFELARDNRNVRALQFSRNFGKESAMLAGLKAADSELTLVMDADLQHPPDLIPDMYARSLEGYDQVVAVRDRADEPTLRRITARTFYRLTNILVDVELVDGAGDFRILSRRVVDNIVQLSENHRFSKGLYSWVGFSHAYVPFSHVAGSRDGSTWTLGKLLNYAIDGIISFNVKPLRVAIWGGLAVSALTFMYTLFVVLAATVWGVDTPGYTTTIAVVGMLGGMQLILLGVAGEYIGRTYSEVKGRPSYLLMADSAQAPTPYE